MKEALATFARQFDEQFQLNACTDSLTAWVVCKGAVACETVPRQMLPEEIQTKIYSIGKENGYKENLRDWFKLIYEVVFGDENGPRMGFFISFFGVSETKDLIKNKLENV